MNVIFLNICFWFLLTRDCHGMAWMLDFFLPQFGIAKLANIISKFMQILEFRIDHIS